MARLWTLAALLACLVALTTSWTSHEQDNSSALNQMPLVFGLDYTMTHVTLSASLPNGTIVGLSAHDGGPEYRAAMASVYREVTDLRPLLSHLALYNNAQLDHWRLGRTVTDLRPKFDAENRLSRDEVQSALWNATRKAKSAAGAVLLDTYGLQIPDRPPAVITVPSWLFGFPGGTEECYALYKSNARGSCDESDQSCRLMLQTTHRTFWVVAASGFDVTINYSRNLSGRQGSVIELHPAAPHSACFGIPGSCYGPSMVRRKYRDIGESVFEGEPKRTWICVRAEEWWNYANVKLALGTTPCRKQDSVVVVLDLSAQGLLTWVEGGHGYQCCAGRAWADVRADDLKLPPIDDSYERELRVWARAVVREALMKVSHSTWHYRRSDGDPNVTAILTGEDWTHEAIQAVRMQLACNVEYQAMTLQEPCQQAFATSMSAAAWARLEERSNHLQNASDAHLAELVLSWLPHCEASTKFVCPDDRVCHRKNIFARQDINNQTCRMDLMV